MSDADYDGGVVYSLGIYIVWFVVLIVPWLFIRQKFPDLYFPRAKQDKKQKSIFKWITPLIKLKGEQLYQQIGRKGFLFLRWKRQALLFMCSLSFVGILLIPLYMYFTQDVAPNVFASTSASSLSSDSYLIWITFFYSVGIACTFITLVAWHRRDLIYTKKLSVTQDKDTFNRVIQLTHIPKTLVSNEDLHQQLEILTEKQIKNVSIALKIKDVDKLQEEKEDAIHELKLYREQQLKEGKEIFFHPLKWGFLPSTQKESAIPYYESKIQQLTDEINTVYIRAKQMNKHTDIAFIIFETHEDAEEVILHWDSLKLKDTRFTKCKVEKAKPYQEIIWQHLGTRKEDHAVRKLSFDVLMVLLAFFWTVPIAFLSNLHNLSSIPFFGDYFENVLDWNVFLSDTVEQMLPVILTWLFHQLLPRFCVYLSKYEKHPDISSLHASAMEKYWIFVILNGFVFYMLFSSGIDFAKTLINNPGEIKLALEELDWALFGSFYCTYLLTMAFLDSALSYLKLKDFVVYHVRWFFVEHKHEERKRKIFETNNFSYHIQFAKESLYFAMIMTFAPIVPFVTVCAILAYVFTFLAAKTSIVLISPREPSLGRKLLLRFGVFLNASILLTFIFWSFFFLTHGNSIVSYIAIPIYLVLWIICFIVLSKTKKEKFILLPHSHEMQSPYVTEDEESEEKYYNWEFIASPSRREQEDETFQAKNMIV